MGWIQLVQGSPVSAFCEHDSETSGSDYWLLKDAISHDHVRIRDDVMAPDGLIDLDEV